jgi:TonB family protein
VKLRSSFAVLALMFATMTAQADSSEMRRNLFQDYNTDRQPASTEFPKYPSIARRDRIEGEATVCFKIDTRGKVSRASVTEYTHKIFRRPALRAIKRSSYEPLEPGQILAKSKTCRTYRFRLEPVVAETSEK